MKTKEKIEARRIRVEEQLSLKSIAERLNVSKGTVSLWVRDLPLSKETIDERCLAGRIKGGKARRFYARNIRVQYQQKGRSMAEKYKNDPLFMGGCMMHWAEGSKIRGSASICNTDKYFLCIWMRFMIKFFNINPDRFCLRIYCYLNNDKTQREIESYWLEQLDLPKSCLRKTVIVTSHRFSTGAKKNKHPYGVATVDIHSTEIVQQIWGAIKELADIDDQDKWLD